MKKVSATQARQNWAETIQLAKTEPVTITDHSRPAVVMMNVELARLALEALEDSQDVKDAIAALKRIEKGGRTYSLALVADQLGIPLE